MYCSPVIMISHVLILQTLGATELALQKYSENLDISNNHEPKDIIDTGNALQVFNIENIILFYSFWQ